MKLFISYRFTGEDFSELKTSLSLIVSALRKNNEVYCSIEDEDFFLKNNFTNKEILNNALKELNNSDALFVYLKSEEKSEGMLIEVGYALAKNKRIILATKKGIKTTFLREIADEIIEFSDVEDLCSKI